MIWIILVVVLLLIIVGVFLFWRTRSRVTSEEAQDVVRWSIGMTAGGIAGIVIGIMLVEFAGYEYPLPVVLWFFGMAAGQIGGVLYNRHKKSESQI
jgi:heme A synthase